MEERTWLILEDASIFSGRGFGFPSPFAEDLQSSGYAGIGEVVFNTAMLGYHEVLTDPSYTGQIIAMTYPHIGNYGVSDDWNESGPLGEGVSDRRPIKAAGFVLRKLYTGPPPPGRHDLNSYLYEHEIPGITEVDTRRLTLKLRDQGSVNGLVISSKHRELSQSEREAALSCLKAFPAMEGRNLISAVGSTDTIAPRSDSQHFTAHQHLTESQQLTASRFKHISLALYDCGTKANIIREFEKLGCAVTIYSSASSASQILAGNHHAIMVSNGPGDPQTLKEQIKTVRGLIGKLPLFGICLGHQLIAEALEARIHKMKFGHHGINHPVRDERTGRVFVTSQNHGFAVDEASLPESTEVWFRNANDQSIEGIRNDELPILTAQFHPESAPGPYDSHWIFEEFLNAIPVNKEY